MPSEAFLRIEQVGRRYQVGSGLIAEARLARQRPAEAHLWREWRSAPGPERAGQIIIGTAVKYGVSLDMLRSKKRTGWLTRARAEVCYRLVTEMPKLSYRRIAPLVGRADHTTVLYLSRRHAETNGLPPPPRRCTLNRYQYGLKDMPIRQWPEQR